MKRFFLFFSLIIVFAFLSGCPEDQQPLTEAPENVETAVGETFGAIGVMFGSSEWGTEDLAEGLTASYTGTQESGTVTLTITNFTPPGGTYIMNGELVITYEVAEDTGTFTFEGTVNLTGGDVSTIVYDCSMDISFTTEGGPIEDTMEGTITVDGTVYHITAFTDIMGE